MAPSGETSQKKSMSERLWVSESGLRSGASPNPILGATASRVLTDDPLYFSIYAARYKFVSRILNQVENLIEVGCGDGFGATFLSKVSTNLRCFDIDERTLEECRQRLARLSNTTFLYHDFVNSPLEDHGGKADALVMVDVLEHIYPEEEESFLKNSLALLRSDGFAVFGTPNVEAERFASENSRRTHVNLKSSRALRETMEVYFDRVILLGQNDEVVHTGFFGMCHYLWAIGFSPKPRVA